MNVLIKGMEMPKSCGNCPMCHSNAEYDYAYCCVSSAETSGNKIPSGCPLIPVPPHGRLIDSDVLAMEMMDAANADQALAMVDDAPTVIEAEGRARHDQISEGLLG